LSIDNGRVRQSMMEHVSMKQPSGTKGEEDGVDEDDKNMYRKITSKETCLDRWPEPYLPTIIGKEITLRQEVGREQAVKAELLYVQTIASSILAQFYLRNVG
jgi:hypothetical protein